MSIGILINILCIGINLVAFALTENTAFLFAMLFSYIAAIALKIIDEIKLSRSK